MHEGVSQFLPDFYISKDLGGCVRRSMERARKEGILHPSFNVVIDRWLEGIPRVHDDGKSVTLSVEGGGLGGVVTGYQLAVLECLGKILDRDPRFAFDYVESRSAANFNATWFLAGEALTGKSTYHTHLAGSPFRNLPFLTNPLTFNRNFRHEKPFLDMPFFRKLINQHAKLDWETFQQWPGKFEVVGTRVDRRLPKNATRIVRFSDFKDMKDLLDAVFACAHIPIVSSHHFPPKPNMYRGIHVWDGGIADGIPISMDESEESSTHVIHLATLPKGSEYAPDYPAQRAIIQAYMYAWDPEVARLYKEKPLREYRQRMYLQAKETRRDGPPYISTIARPHGSTHVGLLEHDPHVLQRAGEEGARALLHAFGLQDSDAIIEDMRTYTYR